MSIPFETAILGIQDEEGNIAQSRAYYRSLYDYASMLEDNSLIVEIGVWKGYSTAIMGSAIQGTRSRIIAIDPILSIHSFNDESVNHLYSSSYEEVEERIRFLKLDGYIALVSDYSTNVLSRWDGRFIDLLYIDGDHHYEAVRKDCEWMQYVKPGGYAAFDDWNSAPHIQAAILDYVSGHPEWYFVHINGAPVPDNFPKDILWDVTILRKVKDAS